MIQPACMEVPRVVSIYPTFEDGYCAANTPITIDFNLEVENSNVINKLKLFLVSDNSDVSDYFEEPHLSEDKKSVIIEPKPKKFTAYINDTLKAAFVDVEVNLEDDIKIISAEQEFSLSAIGGRSFKVRYKPELEEIAPKNYGFFAFTSNDDVDVSTISSDYSGDKFTTDALTDFDNDKIMQNRTKGTVYIWGKYYDAGSGVKTIILTEKRTNDKKGNEVNDETVKPAVYTEKDLTFKKDEIGNTEFCIEYHIKSEDGAVLLTLSASDGCENVDTAENKSVVAIKDSGMDLSDFELQNTSSNLTKIFFLEKVTEINEDSGNEQLFHHPIDNNYVNPGSKNRKIVYGLCSIPTDKLTMVVEYKDQSNTVKKQQLSLEKESDTMWIWVQQIGVDMPVYIKNYKWSTTLDFTEDTLAERQLKLIVTDDIGNVTEKYFTFPSQPKVARFEDKSSDPYFYFANRSANDKIYLQWKNGDYTSTRTASETELAVKGASTDNLTYTAQCIRGGLYGKKTAEFTESDFSGLASLPEVTVTGFDYKKTGIAGKIDVSVILADNSWDIYDDIYYLFSTDFGIKQPIHFTKGKTVSTFTTESEYLFGANKYPSIYNITVFGMKGDSMSPGKVEYPNITDKDFDDVPPELNSYSPSSDSYKLVGGYLNSHSINDTLELYRSVIVCSANDSESGIDYMTIKVSDNAKELRYEADDHYYEGVFIIPYWDLNGSDSCHITVYDKTGNSTSKDLVVSFMETPKIQYNDRNYIYKFDTKPLSENRYRWDYSFFKWNTDKWEKVYNYLTNYASSSSTYNSPRTSVPVQANGNWATSGGLYKVIVKFQDKDYKYFATTSPEYYYNGTQSTGKYDYIIPKTNKSVLVSSDSVTFVQTLVTQRPYSECKDWDIDEWQYHRKSIGEERLDFSNTNSAAQKYTIPYDKINDGECYVVIAHFANGGTDISEVFQK